MIDHFTLTVPDLKKAKAFYTAALKPLGYKPVRDYGKFLGFGDRRPYFWLKEGSPATQPMHIAFVALDRSAVDAFHEAAIAAGAKDDGKPGVRQMYHPHYYGAFVIDPFGHPIEAVCHSPDAGEQSLKAKRPGAGKAKRKTKAA
jgi:catechol 2,3-dioxygenase-like lactoylglutathione lyase family enzyme